MLNLLTYPTKYIWQAFCNVMYKQTNTICKPKRFPVFAVVINNNDNEKNPGFPGLYMQYVT